MRRLILILLCVAATVDISQTAYSIDLIGSIANRTAGTSLFGAIVHSPWRRSSGGRCSCWGSARWRSR